MTHLGRISTTEFNKVLLHVNRINNFLHRRINKNAPIDYKILLYSKLISIVNIIIA